MHLHLAERSLPVLQARQRGKDWWEKWCKQWPKTPGCDNSNSGGGGSGNGGKPTTTSTPKPTPTPKPAPAPAPVPAPAPAKTTTTPAAAKPVTTQQPAKNNPAPSTTKQQQPAETKPAATETKLVASDRAGAEGNGDTAATASPIVGASPAVPSVNDEDIGGGSGGNAGGGQGGDNTSSGFNPLVTGVAGTGGGSGRNGGNGGNSNVVPGTTSGVDITGTSAGNDSSSKGLGAGAIAGIVVGLLALLGLIALALFLWKKKKAKDNKRPGSGYPASLHGPEGMDKTLLAAGAGPTAAGAAVAGAGGGGGIAAAAARRNSRTQPPMRQTSNIPPHLLPVSMHNNSRNLTSPTNDSPTSSRAFTPSPISPMSPASMLGSAPPPAAFYPGRPTYVPPENMSAYPGRPQYVPPPPAPAAIPRQAAPIPRKPAPPQTQHQHQQQQQQQQRPPTSNSQSLHVAHAARGSGKPNRSGSVSSVSTGSALSAILNPAQMVWPMPPPTPPTTAPATPKTRDGQGHGRNNSSRGSQPYVDFHAAGQTVVRINNPPGSRRGQQPRRPSGY